VLRSSVLAAPARLVVDGREIVLRRAVTTIGRADDQVVVLDDPSVSRRHAEIRVVGAEAHLVDVGSSNGVVVNDQRVGATALADGDVIRLGGCELVYRTGA
jgi:pSer/pThr/pTyr-binding forkhead associated (FHA) protein